MAAFQTYGGRVAVTFDNTNSAGRRAMGNTLAVARRYRGAHVVMVRATADAVACEVRFDSARGQVAAERVAAHAHRFSAIHGAGAPAVEVGPLEVWSA